MTKLNFYLKKKSKLGKKTCNFSQSMKEDGAATNARGYFKNVERTKKKY